MGSSSTDTIRNNPLRIPTDLGKLRSKRQISFIGMRGDASRYVNLKLLEGKEINVQTAFAPLGLTLTLEGKNDQEIIQEIMSTLKLDKFFEVAVPES